MKWIKILNCSYGIVVAHVNEKIYPFSENGVNIWCIDGCCSLYISLTSLSIFSPVSIHSNLKLISLMNW